jgi:hypothetical protein
MAIRRTSEKTWEDSWINALTKWTDLSAYTKRRFSDQSSARTFPVILVHCSAVDDPRFGNPESYDEAYVELMCCTWKDSDLDGSTVRQMMGGVRDLINQSDILSRLENVGGVKVLAIRQEGPSRSDEQGDSLRTLSLTIITYGSLIHGVTP